MNNQKLRLIDTNLWGKEQPLKYFGLEFGTRMTVIRIDQKQLVLISPIQLDKETIAEINSLGTVKYIIAPNLFHHFYIQDCKSIYPNASLIAAPGLETKKPNLKIDYVFTQDPIDFNHELEYFLFAGFQTLLPSGFTMANEIVFYHVESQTLILTDTAFYFDQNFPLISQFAGRLIGCYQKLRPSILEKIATQDRKKVTASIKKLLQWNFQRVIMAHGTIVEKNGKQQLIEGYEWFLDEKIKV